MLALLTFALAASSIAVGRWHKGRRPKQAHCDAKRNLFLSQNGYGRHRLMYFFFCVCRY